VQLRESRGRRNRTPGYARPLTLEEQQESPLIAETVIPCLTAPRGRPTVRFRGGDHVSRARPAMTATPCRSRPASGAGASSRDRHRHFTARSLGDGRIVRARGAAVRTGSEISPTTKSTRPLITTRSRSSVMQLAASALRAGRRAERELHRSTATSPIDGALRATQRRSHRRGLIHGLKPGGRATRQLRAPRLKPGCARGVRVW